MELGFGTAVFIGMVSLAVFLLSISITVPVFGEKRTARKRLQRRLNDLRQETEQSAINSLIREKYLKQLSGVERELESMPGMERMAKMIEQSGHTILAYRLVLLSLVLALVLGGLAWWLSQLIWLGVGIGLIGLCAPYVKVMIDRQKRLDRFDEQLPEALDIIKRALQAGHPFSESLHLVSDGLEGPVGEEFGITFADLNYGNDLRRAMLGLLERVPSITLLAFVTSVLVQRETGGNLAEILDNISRVIRGRFRFHRKVKTLSAEGRLSAWILALVPFGLFVMIHLSTPEYLPVLVNNPTGHELIMIAGILMVIGVYWIRHILKIEV